MKGAAGATPCYAQHTLVQLFLRFSSAPPPRLRASRVQSSARGGRVRQLPGGRMMFLITKINGLSCCNFFFFGLLAIVIILVFLTLSQPALRHIDMSPSNFRYRQLRKFTRFPLHEPYDHPSECRKGGPGDVSGGPRSHTPRHRGMATLSRSPGRPRGLPVPVGFPSALSKLFLASLRGCWMAGSGRRPFLHLHTRHHTRD